MNYYKKVAEMLNLEMYERFKLKSSDGIDCYGGTYYFSEDGLKCLDSPLNNNWVLASILFGKAEIVKLPWKPKEGEEYWHYSEAWNEGIPCKWEGGWFDLLLWKAGNCFRTREEASIEGKENIEQIQKEFEEA